MSQISKCPKVTVVLTYWEASREVSELSYKVYFISVLMDHTVPVKKHPVFATKVCFCCACSFFSLICIFHFKGAYHDMHCISC